MGNYEPDIMQIGSNLRHHFLRSFSGSSFYSYPVRVWGKGVGRREQVYKNRTGKNTQEISSPSYIKMLILQYSYVTQQICQVLSLAHRT